MLVEGGECRDEDNDQTTTGPSHDTPDLTS